MARIIGSVCSSHVPAIGGAIAKGLQNEPYWKPFFDGFPPVRDWLARERPDVAVVFYNDHGLNFFLDKMPTFAVMRSCISPLMTDASSRPPPFVNAASFACSRSTNSRTSPRGTVGVLASLSQ